METRRKLIKAALAAPAVFTVRTASATAMSSAMACITRDDQQSHEWPYPEKCMETHEDEWLRMKKDLVEIHKYGSTKPLSNRRFFLSHDGKTYWELIPDGDSYRAEPKYSTAEYGKYRKVGDGKFLAYHKDGDIVGYGWEDKGGKNITKSCWTSIKLSGQW
jgi:hypothetical protein